MQERHWVAGDLQVDLALQQVSRAGEPIKLPKLSFDLLLALLEAAPAILSLDDLMSRVWKGLVVSPETVTQRVKLLRDALGDEPLTPRYIEGVRGRGYRWVATVTRDVPAIPSPDKLPPEPVPHRLPLWPLATIGALVLAVVGAVAIHRGSAPPRSLSMIQRTVAVLPFASLGMAGEDTAISAGLADTVLDRLAHVRGLTVIARESSFRSDLTNLSPQLAGQRLNAGYLVTGSVQREGARLRVNARLVDATRGVQLWSRQFERETPDVFEIQDTIAGEVTSALESRIAGLDPSRPPPSPRPDMESWLAYQRGRALVARFTVAGCDAAAMQFQRAIELDPKFEAAYVALYDARLQGAALRRLPLEPARRENQHLLDEAQKLTPDSGAAHYARAMWAKESPEQQEADFRLGVQLDPSNSRGLVAYSEFLDGANRRDEGEVMLSRALWIDPLSPRGRFRVAQRTFNVIGAEVEKQTLRVLELDPAFYPALQRYAKYQWMMHGETARAVSIIRSAIEADPENPWARHTAAAFYVDLQDPAAAEAVAAATPVSTASIRPMIASYRGDWRAAGEAALQPASFVFNAAERWCVAMALRDYALKTGEFTRVEALLSERYELQTNGAWLLAPSNFREGELLAHLMLADGRREQGLARLREVRAWIDANPHYGPVYNVRTRAQALKLEGQRDSALAELASSFDQGDYTHWWYTLERDPTWDDARTDPRFIAMAERVRRHMAEQRSLLASELAR